MANNSQIQLNTTRISYIPFGTFVNDFTFIVNGREYQTSRLVSDLLSPVICQLHAGDPTINTFSIRTQNHGDFQNVLNLINFQQNSIPAVEIPFFVEVMQILGISSNDIADLNQQESLNDDNIFELTRRHEQFEVIYSESFNRDIDYIASNFFKLCDSRTNDLNSLLPTTLERIISSDRLKLKNEDQLFKFINQIYRNQNNLNYSNLYHYVLYSNVKHETMVSFIENFDFNDLDRETWSAITNRLKNPILIMNEDQNERYAESNGRIFYPQYEDNFSGIINYIRSKSNGNISNKISISSSPYNSSYPPTNTVNYENMYSYFCSQGQQNNWICFDFRESKIIPSHYQIMSYNSGINAHNPKSWVIQGSNDNSVWVNLDEQHDCPFLNDANKSHVFKISNSNQYRYIKMQLIGTNWSNNYHFCISSFELYGKLI